MADSFKAIVKQWNGSAWDLMWQLSYVTRFEKTQLPHMIVNIYKYHFNHMKYCNLGRKRDTRMTFATFYDLSINQLLNEQLAEFSTILDSFQWCSQYHQHCYRVGGWGWVGNHEVIGKGCVNTENSQMASIGTIFTSTYHTKQLNPWSNSSASRVVNYGQLPAYQRNMEPFEEHPSTHGCLTSLRNKPQKSNLSSLRISVPIPG